MLVYTETTAQIWLILYLSLCAAENPKQLQVCLRRPAAENGASHVHSDTNEKTTPLLRSVPYIWRDRARQRRRRASPLFHRRHRHRPPVEERARRARGVHRYTRGPHVGAACGHPGRAPPPPDWDFHGVFPAAAAAADDSLPATGVDFHDAAPTTLLAKRRRTGRREARARRACIIQRPTVTRAADACKYGHNAPRPENHDFLASVPAERPILQALANRQYGT